ncbi:MAG: LapA family protein [Chitinophagales bacterium]
MLVVWLVIAVIAVVFTLQNSSDIEVVFFLWQVETPLALLIIITMLLGVIAALALTMPAYFSGRNSESKYKKESAALRTKNSEQAAKIKQLEARAEIRK